MKPKTTRQILNMAKELRYYRQADYNRAYALTKFIKQLEKKAKEEDKFFQIIVTKVIKMQCRYLKEDNSSPYNTLAPDPKTEVAAFKFIRFAYGEETFYIQFDDNPFFESYMKRHIEMRERRINKSEQVIEVEAGYIRIFDTVDIDVLWRYNGMKNINILTKHLWTKFHEIRKTNTVNTYAGRVKDLKQIIYGL